MIVENVTSDFYGPGTVGLVKGPASQEGIAEWGRITLPEILIDLAALGA